MNRLRSSSQQGILAGVPRQAGYLFLSRQSGVTADLAEKALRRLVGRLRFSSDESTALSNGAKKNASAALPVLGLSALFVQALGGQVAGLRTFPTFANAKVDLPITQSDLVVWLRGADQGEIFHAMRQLCASTDGALKVDTFVSAFKHRDGHDLSGFEDGTENPKGAKAIAAALSEDGSSFLALQQWEHHFPRFDAISERARNHAVGRDLKTNEELETAPATSHVKRTAQETFTPEAFLLRRSMPWVEGTRGGLMFTAFGRSFDAFEAQLKRMSGADDGKIDGLFGFTRPLGGGYYWCPPVQPDGALNLAALNPLAQ